jgi:thioester reductase-like protein
VRDNFFSLGGDLLRAAVFANRLQQELGQALPVAAVFSAPTVEALAEYLQRYNPSVVAQFRTEGSATTGGAPPAEAAEPDLEAEVILNPAIRADAPAAAVTELRHVFLTGATGFLGAYLLRDLLEHTHADVLCLVRAADSEAALRRNRKGLDLYGLWQDSFRDRIRPVLGDLGRPLLGLSPHRFDLLVNEVEIIYHSGAQVHFLSPYADLKAANVGGTHEVLRLAALRRPKPVNYVSTLGVFPYRPGALPVGEQDAVPPANLEGGYNQSKWVAERLVALAGRRGLPVSIYRPGRVAWDSRTGAANANDLLSGLVRLLLRVGSYLRLGDGGMSADVTPVDFVSAAVVRLSLRPDSCGHVFHLLNPRPTDLRLLLEFLCGFGYPLREVTAEQWRAGLPVGELAASGDGGAVALASLLALGTAASGEVADSIDCRQTTADLAALGLSCPPVDAASMRRFLTYSVRAGVLPEPPAANR